MEVSASKGNFVLETNNKINWTVTAQLFRILKLFNFSRTWTWKFVALRPLLENLSCFLSGIREVSSYLRCNLPWPASNIPGALRLLRLVPPCCLTSITKWTQCCIDVIWKFDVMSRSNVTLKHTRSIFSRFFFWVFYQWSYDTESHHKMHFGVYGNS